MKLKTKSQSAKKKQLEKKLRLDRNRKAADTYYDKWTRRNRRDENQRRTA